MQGTCRGSGARVRRDERLALPLLLGQAPDGSGGVREPDLDDQLRQGASARDRHDEESWKENRRDDVVPVSGQSSNVVSQASP